MRGHQQSYLRKLSLRLTPAQKVKRLERIAKRAARSKQD